MVQFALSKICPGFKSLKYSLVLQLSWLNSKMFFWSANLARLFFCEKNWLNPFSNENWFLNIFAHISMRTSFLQKRFNTDTWCSYCCWCWYYCCCSYWCWSCNWCCRTYCCWCCYYDAAAFDAIAAIAVVADIVTEPVISLVVVIVGDAVI